MADTVTPEGGQIDRDEHGNPAFEVAHLAGGGMLLSKFNHRSSGQIETALCFKLYIYFFPAPQSGIKGKKQINHDSDNKSR